MAKFFSMLTLMFVCAAVAMANNPSDPLDPMYLPPIDTDPSHYPSNVWVTGPLAKIHPDAAVPSPLHWAEVASARNEFQSFQIHVQAGTNPINLSVAVGDLVDARSGTHIPASSNIIIYREAYLNITRLSDLNGTSGLVPDILIPAVDPYYHEPRNAFPFTIPANRAQSVWVDIFTPGSAPSGYYTGTVTVSDGATTLATLPVRLKVWDWIMPSTATLKSLYDVSYDSFCIQVYGSHAGCAAYPGSGGSVDLAIDLIHEDEAVMFLDHRVSLSNGSVPIMSNGKFAAFDARVAPLMNGTPANRNTMLPGAKWTSLVYFPVGIVPTDAANIQKWVTHFQEQGWLNRVIQYHCDEPSVSGTGTACTFASALAESTFVHSSSTPPMQTLLTTDITSAIKNQPGLLQSIDIFTPTLYYIEPSLTAGRPSGGPNQRSVYDPWLSSPSKHIWWYIGCTSSETCGNGTVGPKTATWPNYDADVTPVRNRIFQWFAYLDRIEGELYFQTDICWQTGMNCGAGTPSGPQSDPWLSIYHYGNNGDGTLMYPGSIARVGGTTPIPLPSLRLKMIRDGMQDYEYLIALDKAGQGEFARTTARTFITNAFTFSNDPNGLLTARDALGTKLHQIGHSSAKPAGPTNLKAVVR